MASETVAALELFDCRDAYSNTLLQLAEEDTRIVAVVSDSLGSSKLGLFRERYPERVINVGIAESNMVGVAAGLANGGRVPFVSAASCFLTARALEQIKVDVAYSGANVKLCGMSPGLAYGELGPTHHSLEDLAWLRAIPGLSIVIPADPVETAGAIRAAAVHDGPVFIRVSRMPVPAIFAPDHEFTLGQAVTLRTGSDVTIIATGTMVARALDAATLLSESDVDAGVLAVSTLKPLDTHAILEAAARTGTLVTVEEHSVRGGLGSAVAEAVVSSHPVPMRLLGVPDTFAPTGSSAWLLDYFNLNPIGIRAATLELLGVKNEDMTEPVVLALDQGTTHTKAVLVEQSGAVIDRAVIPVERTYPQPGWVEQDPSKIWKSVTTAIRGLRRDLLRSVATVAVTNQRESILLWERATGRPIGPCVGWQCRRGDGYTSAISARNADDFIRSATGLRLDPSFSAPKAAWLLEQEPGLLARAASGELCLGTVDSWLIWKLTGERSHSTDASNASRTLLFNIHSLAWDDELLELFSIPRPLLAEVLPSNATRGVTTLSALPPDTPIDAVMGDSQAALFRYALGTSAITKASYGTGTSVMTTSCDSTAPGNGLLLTVAWQQEQPVYAIEGHILSTGSTLQWVADLLQLAGGASRAAELAATVASTSDVYLVPAFSGLGSPYFAPDARGLISGLTFNTGAAQVARAALESTCYQVRDVIESLERQLAAPITQLWADGSAARNDWLIQLQANLLDRTIVRPYSDEAPALGAAYMAGLARGVWSNPDDLQASQTDLEIFEPRMDPELREQLYEGWRDAVATAANRGQPPDQELAPSTTRPQQR